MNKISNKIAFAVSAAISYVSKRGEVLAVKPQTNHPHDWFLVLVLWRNEKGQFVTHSFNAEIAGLNHGHYHATLDDALNDFAERGQVHPQDALPAISESLRLTIIEEGLFEEVRENAGLEESALYKVVSERGNFVGYAVTSDGHMVCWYDTEEEARLEHDD